MLQSVLRSVERPRARLSQPIGSARAATPKLSLVAQSIFTDVLNRSREGLMCLCPCSQPTKPAVRPTPPTSARIPGTVAASPAESGSKERTQAQSQQPGADSRADVGTLLRRRRVALRAQSSFLRAPFLLDPFPLMLFSLSLCLLLTAPL